jgi:hypothetical protein
MQGESKAAQVGHEGGFVGCFCEKIFHVKEFFESSLVKLPTIIWHGEERHLSGL